MRYARLVRLPVGVAIHPHKTLPNAALAVGCGTLRRRTMAQGPRTQRVLMRALFLCVVVLALLQTVAGESRRRHHHRRHHSHASVHASASSGTFCLPNMVDHPVFITYVTQQFVRFTLLARFIFMLLTTSSNACYFVFAQRSTQRPSLNVSPAHTHLRLRMLRSALTNARGRTASSQRWKR